MRSKTTPRVVAESVKPFAFITWPEVSPCGPEFDPGLGQLRFWQELLKSSPVRLFLALGRGQRKIKRQMARVEADGIGSFVVSCCNQSTFYANFWPFLILYSLMCAQWRSRF